MSVGTATPRREFARKVHAEAHAIVALREVKRVMDRTTTRQAIYRHLDDEIYRRCDRLNIEPDLLCDLIEDAEDEAAIASATGVGS